MKQHEIAVGIIYDDQKGIYITQRSDGSHLAGCWEFPGGKIGRGENALQGLQRELEEEIGIMVTNAKLLQQFKYAYTDKYLTLHFFLVDEWQNEPYGKEGQAGRWCHINQLNEDEFPQANRHIIALLKAGLLLTPFDDGESVNNKLIV